MNRSIILRLLRPRARRPIVMCFLLLLLLQSSRSSGRRLHVTAAAGRRRRCGGRPRRSQIRADGLGARRRHVGNCRPRNGLPRPRDSGVRGRLISPQSTSVESYLSHGPADVGSHGGAIAALAELVSLAGRADPAAARPANRERSSSNLAPMSPMRSRTAAIRIVCGSGRDRAVPCGAGGVRDLRRVSGADCGDGHSALSVLASHSSELQNVGVNALGGPRRSR